MKTFLGLCLTAILLLSGCTSTKLPEQRLVLQTPLQDEESKQASSSSLDPFHKIWEEIAYLEKMEEWDLVFHCLHRYLDINWSSETLQKNIEYINKLITELDNRFDQKCASKFLIPEDGGRKEKDEKARSQVFCITTKEKAREAAAQYDRIKTHLKYCIELLDKHYPLASFGENTEEQETILKLKNDARDAKDRLICNRCVFISYGVVDPVLAETEKYIYLSRGKWWKLYQPDYENLKLGITFMAHAFNNTWLFECDEPTRMHFYQVQTKLKEMSARRRWEDFIVMTTLMDSWDPSKYRGAEAWWTGQMTK